MAERKEYRSALRSRRLIRKAFDELMQEREFSRITVTDIVNRADLHRSTFYAHYPDIYGIVDEMQDEIIRENMQLFTQIEYRNILKDPMPYLQSIAKTLNETTELLRRLGHTVSLQQQLDKYRRLMTEDIMYHSDVPEEVRRSPYFSARVCFFLGGIMSTYQQWAEGNMDCTLEEISRDIARVIQQTASAFLETDWTQAG